MATSWKSLIDPKLKSEFEKTGPDPRAAEKVRAKFNTGLDKALASFKAGTTRGRQQWKKNNGVVEFSPTLGVAPVALDGATTLYIPEGRFEAFIGALKQSASAGELDAALQAPTGKSGAAAKPRQTRNVSEESRLNIRIGGFRRGGKSDAEIAKLLKGEGVEDAKIKAALAYKRAK
jgi:hypothetical protein